ncbi:DUF3261 domain-containing protein [Vibrio gangliei]|uniref:DUF3261 domain-containing protein n=1 Tax=Vibrio gangliei TaxID=2077090 RepID=UPI001FE304A7|nr:DUF3261 domain-containing protein [Vibrio gangliei]
MLGSKMSKKVVTCLMLCFSLLLTGCAQTTDQQNNVQQENAQQKNAEQQNKVQLDDNAWVSLPQPADLGYTLTASQLLSVSYQDQAHQQQSQQLPIQLQVSQDKVVLAGFSSWGTRLLSLSYHDQQFDTYVMTGLSDQLPKPEQVLFNMMITLWPIEVWQTRLAPLGWQLTETQTSTGKTRVLLNSDQKTVAEIHYANIEPLKGDITFINHVLNFTIVIKTLQYQAALLDHHS